MPSNFLTADTTFPILRDEQSTDEKFRVMTDYLFMLLEQLRYTLGNLGEKNFNDAELEGITKRIAEPVYLYLGGLKLTVADGENEASILQLKAGETVLSSAEIKITGAVTFADLAGSGTSVINGDNIKTGTLTGCTLCTLRTMQGAVMEGGEIRMCFMTNDDVAGGMRLDFDQNVESGSNPCRLFIYTNNINGNAFALKLLSAGDISIEAAGNIWLKGNVYINGAPVSVS